MKKERIAAAAAITGVAAMLAIIGYIILPDTLVVKFNMAGEATSYMPKLAALALSFVISMIGCGIWLFAPNKNKGILVSIVGILTTILMFIFNL